MQLPLLFYFKPNCLTDLIFKNMGNPVAKVGSKSNIRIYNKKFLLSGIQKKDPAIAKVITNATKFIIDKLNLNKFDTVICGVSGGVDSIVMLDVLANLSVDYGFNLIVTHFNHKLRDEDSNDDEKFVLAKAEQYKIPCYAASDNVKLYAENNQFSIEDAARKLRYKFFERTAKSLKASFIATAHTADDSAETMLLNLFRGSGLTGLSGIPRQRIFQKRFTLIRPLIDCYKFDLIEYAKARKLDWREDASNLMLFYTRNKIRVDLLPKLKNEYSPSIIPTLNRTSRLIAGADKFIANYVNEHLNRLILDRRQNQFSMPINILNTFEEFIQGEIIHSAIQTVFKGQPLPLQTIDRILKIIHSPTGSTCEINKKLIVLKDRDELVFARRQEPIKIEKEIDVIGEIMLGQRKLILKEVDKDLVKFSQNTNIEFFDLDLLPKTLKLRNWQTGDSFQPIGFDGRVKVSDFLTNKKINQFDKQNVMILANHEDIIWIIGMRAGEKYKINSETKRFLKAEIL